jgi:hypothetical protein
VQEATLTQPYLVWRETSELNVEYDGKIEGLSSLFLSER